MDDKARAMTHTGSSFMEDFQGNAAQFLYIPDYVAEREGFEPSVQLWNA
jgi:hypothetical protein